MKISIIVIAALGLVACGAGQTGPAECSDGACSTLRGTSIESVTDRGKLEWSRETGEGTWTPNVGRPGAIRVADLTAKQANKIASELSQRTVSVPPAKNGYVTCTVDDSYADCQEFSVYGANCTACVTVDSDCSSSLRTVCTQTN